MDLYHNKFCQNKHSENGQNFQYIPKIISKKIQNKYKIKINSIAHYKRATNGISSARNSKKIKPNFNL